MNFINILLYGGLSREKYYNALPGIVDDNRDVLSVLSVIGIISFVLMGFVRAFDGRFLLSAVHFYCAIIMLVICVINLTVSRKWPRISNISAVVFNFVLLFEGIVIVRESGNEKVSIILPFFIIASVIFCVRPLFLIITNLFAEYLLILTIIRIQTTDMARINIVSSLAFCLVGIVIGVYLKIRDHKRYYVEYRNQYLVERDQLTKVYNRRKFDEELSYIRANRIPVTICVFDVNELKVINDTIGHEAGDELIIGASECINRVFKEYGKIFRTGGDEFVAILDKPILNVDSLKEKFLAVQKNWKGNQIDYISISLGMASINNDVKEFLDTTIYKAEKAMYANKEEHYKSKGIDRCGQVLVHTALCNLYTKILKINLTLDNYEVIGLNEEDESIDNTGGNISHWIMNFVNQGQVHPDDLNVFLKNTDMDYLKNHFLSSNNPITFRYRRLSNGEYRWAVMDIITANDYSYDNQSLFLYVKCIE